jgi:hypothetical protein
MVFFGVVSFEIVDVSRIEIELQKIIDMIEEWGC